jgi:hypothetical protein
MRGSCIHRAGSSAWAGTTATLLAGQLLTLQPHAHEMDLSHQ